MASSLAKIMSRMTDAEHQEIEKNLFALIYASYGTGKTTLAAGIAQAIRKLFGGKILFLDSSEGAAALDNIPSLKRGMMWLPIRDPADLMTVAQALKSKKRVKLGDITVDFGEFTVVIMDEVDSWFEIILHRHVREVTGTLPTEDLPEIEGKMYAAPTQAMLNVINEMHAAEDLHVILVAHEQERGKEPKIYTSPSLPPKLMKGINEKVHLVGRLEAIIGREGYTREIQVNPSKAVVAKSRIGGLPVKVPFNDLPGIIKNWVSSGQMEQDLTIASPDPEPVEDSEVDTEEVETADFDDEAVEISDDEDAA